MAIFNSYVKLPEGIVHGLKPYITLYMTYLVTVSIHHFPRQNARSRHTRCARSTRACWTSDLDAPLGGSLGFFDPQEMDRNGYGSTPTNHVV